MFQCGNTNLVFYNLEKPIKMAEFQARSEEIHQLLADDNLNRAIRRLLDFIRDFVEDSDLQSEVIVASANLKKYTRQERQNLLDFDDSTRIRSRIINHILEVHKDACTIYEESKLMQAAKTPPAVPPATKPIATPPPPQNIPRPLTQQHTANHTIPNRTNPARVDQSYVAPRKTVLTVEKVSKEYKKSGFRLNNFNFELKKNEILGVIGENGNGKTTLFRILTGELKHDEGDIKFPAFNENNPDKLNWINIKTNLAYVQQELPHWHGSLLDNLYYEASTNNIKGETNRKNVEFIIHRLGLTEHVDKKWSELSGGYKLRFSLAKALIKKPRLLVLDEPLANLDINAQTLVLNDLRDLANSIKYPISIVVSSQHLHEVEYIADKILFIRTGNVVFNGLKSDLGKDRKYNYFELQTDLHKEELMEALRNLKIIDVIYETMYAQLITPLDVTNEQVIKELLNKKIPITYFRDISRSTKKLFV